MSWDYIVIGAGSAGCALTHQLVKAGRRVLVLEAGGSDRSPFVKIPAGLAVGSAFAKRDWGYRTQPDSSRHGLVESWPRGRAIGGSSTINGTIYMRGAAEDFDRWSALCNHEGGWSAKNIIPLFREIEGSDQPGALRGRSGPLRTRTVKHPHPITQAFVQAAGAAGYPFNEDYNDVSQAGVSYMQFTQNPRGLRCSAADAFLKPLLGTKNLKLVLHALVEKVEISNGRAVAVAYQYQGQRYRETARDIILCAGSINTPQLLMLSGVGEPEELKRNQVDVVHALPGVGRNLTDQPITRMVYRSTIPTYNLTEGWLQKLEIAAKFFLKGEGPISNLFEALTFVKSSPSEPIPDLQSVFYAMGWIAGHDGKLKPAPYPAFMVSLSKTYPVSIGRIRLRSRRPEDAPVIEHALLQEQDDVDKLVLGIQALRQIMKQDPIARLIEEEVTPGRQVESVEALRQFIRSTATARYHPIGTCRMGVDEGAVVSPDLRVRGLENLWIADASIMPTHLSANTNAPSIMIGVKLGRQLRGGQR